MADERFDQTEPRPLLGVAEHHATAAATPVLVRVAVTNAAVAPRVLSVAAVGVDASWTEGPRRTEVLAPGASAVVELLLTPPQGTLPATYPLVIAVQALDPETGRPTTPATGTAEVALVVNPRSQLSIDLKPRQLSLIATRRFTVELRNTGTAPASVKLLLKSTTHVSFTLARDEVKVRPGATVIVRGRARAKRPTTMGPRMVHNFTLTARGTETMKHLEGHVVQKPMIAQSWLKLISLVLVLAVWVGAAVVLIPALAERVQTSSEEEAAATAPGAEEEAAGEDGAEEGEDEAEGEDGEEGAEGESEGEAEDEGLLLSGNVTGIDPSGASIRMQRISLVDEAVDGSTGVGVEAEQIGGTDLRPVSALVTEPDDDAATDVSVLSGEDGSWSLPPVPARGYYLVEFTKAGFETERFIVDPSSEAAAEPLEVDMVPGEGSLAGRIVGRDGRPIGGATITVTDGTHTVTTNSNSEGAVGTWEIQGLSTPSTYVVSATKYAMSSEARVVDVAAGAAGRADLTLVPGVAALSGQVTGPGTGDARKLTGVTVTVTDGEGMARSTTTLTSLDVRGRYTLPALPAPGTYSVTASRTGYQSESRALVLTKGQAQRPRFDFELSTATGTLEGTVAEPPPAGASTRTAGRTTGQSRKAAPESAGIPSAGLTLANPDHTYKSMSGNDGSYQMTGIAPGDYVLATEFYGKTTTYQNVTIQAGDPTSLDVSLVDAPGLGLATTSAIRGAVIDATSGEALTAACATPETPCLTATVTPQTVEGIDPRAPITVTFAAADGYLIELGEDGLALGPGLHRVTVRAPGYEAGAVDVQVVSGAQTEAPLMEMYPAPQITGTVTAAVGDVQFPTSCVWVFQGSVNNTQLDAKNLDCDAPGDHAVCQDAGSTYDGMDTVADTWCAVTDAEGTYSVQVPSRGGYTVYVLPEQTQFIPTALRSITVGRAEAFEYNPIIDRYGEVELTVVVPSGVRADEDALVPVPEGTVVTVSPASAISDEFEAGADGKVVVSGLRDRQSYTFRAEVERPQASESNPFTTLWGTNSTVTATNETKQLTLQVIQPVPGFVGRVTSTYDDQGTPLQGIDVTLDAALTYTEGGAVVYDLPFTPTTDALGCFAVASASRPTRSGTCESAPLVGSDTWGAALRDRKVATNQLRSITIAKDGYTTGVWTYHQLSTLKVNEFELDPAPVPFDVQLGLDPTPPSLGAALDWDGQQTPANPDDDVTITITDQPSGTGDIALGIAPSAEDPDLGVLSWTDPEVQDAEGVVLPGQARPGTYRITIEAPADYESVVDATLTCDIDGDCTWATSGSERLDLKQRGNLQVTVVDRDGALLPANLKLAGVPGGGDTSPDGTVTFTRLGVGTLSNPVFSITRAAGYQSGTTADADSLRPLLTCTGTPDPDTSIRIRAGQTTLCRVTMRHRLATITGTLKGMLAAETYPVPGDADGFDYLANRTVVLQRCTDATCDQISFSMSQTTSLPDPANAAHPNGARFSFSGTSELEMRAGTYLLTVPEVPGGYAAPRTTLKRATVVTVPEVLPADAIVAADAHLWADPVDLQVQITDQHGAPVTDATVYAHRRDTDSPGVDSDPHTGSTGGTSTYALDDLVPGRTVFWITGPGLAPQGQAQRVLAQASGGGQVLALVVVRDGQGIEGLVETTESTGTRRLDGVRVTLTCRTPTTTPAAFCPATGPALGTGRQPLVATTDEDGHYTVDNVPVGRFTVTFSKQGYLTEDLPTPVEVRASPRDPDGVQTLPLVNIEGVNRTVTVVITSSYADPSIGPVSVVLSGVGSTPASPITATATPDPGSGTWRAQFLGVRWGCYDLAVTTSALWQGTGTGPTGSPTQDDLNCGDADVVVPDTSNEAIQLGYQLRSGRLGWSLVDVPAPGHSLPPVTITATQGSTVRTISIAADTGSTTRTGFAFLPPGIWTVATSVPAGDAPYWTISPPSTIEVVDGADVPMSVTLREKLFPVTIRIPSMPDSDLGVAQVRISPGAAQTGTYTADLDMVGREVVVDLPRGRWLIEGAWSTGPNATSYTVTAEATTRVVVLGPDTPPPAAPTSSSSAAPDDDAVDPSATPTP